MFLMEIGLSTFQFRFTTEYHLLCAASVVNTRADADRLHHPAPPHHGVGRPHRAQGLADATAGAFRPFCLPGPPDLMATRSVARSGTIRPEEGARMIPDRVIEVLTGPSYIQIGTRDAEPPAGSHVRGGRRWSTRIAETVTVLVPTRPRARGFWPTWRATAGSPSASPWPRTRPTSSRAATSPRAPPTRATSPGRRPTGETLLDDALRVGFPEEIARPLTQGLAYTPSIAITFRAEQVYLQTPGPGAGTRLSSGQGSARWGIAARGDQGRHARGDPLARRDVRGRRDAQRQRHLPGLLRRR